ncbi:MAG: polysaccharide deacetylase family protein [bacterium]|nr:polysaccharide deacetylase family protein [bacterium]
MKKAIVLLIISIVLLGTISCKSKSNLPGNLKPVQVPQFVVFGFDDNGYSGAEGSVATGGMNYITGLFASMTNPAGTGNTATYDGAPLHFSFYCNTKYIASETAVDNPVYVKEAWKSAIDNGHEMGNHTHSHPHGRQLSVQQWDKEMKLCFQWLTKPYEGKELHDLPFDAKGLGMTKESIKGFRTPFLEYNDNTFTAARNNGFLYDCSIEEGMQKDQDGTNFLWPYKLDNGSPGDKESARNHNRRPIGKHPGLWEIPAYAFIVPPDEKCEQYGVKKGLRSKLAKIRTYFHPEDGKITGFDWNLWVDFSMTKAEVLATLKYTLDLRLKGNRCPLTVGTHADIYTDKNETLPNATLEERQQTLKEFIQYALEKPDVRIVSSIELLNWIRKPVPLSSSD